MRFEYFEIPTRQGIRLGQLGALLLLIHERKSARFALLHPLLILLLECSSVLLMRRRIRRHRGKLVLLPRRQLSLKRPRRALFYLVVVGYLEGIELGKTEIASPKPSSRLRHFFFYFVVVVVVIVLLSRATRRMPMSTTCSPLSHKNLYRYGCCVGTVTAD